MATNLELFGRNPSIGWLPDETLFSLCSRHHQLSGNRLASTTCRILFGHATQGCAHDFPSRVSHFAQVTGGVLGTAEEIVLHHTVLPLYLPFAWPDTAAAAIDAMCGPSIGSLKFRLGLLTSRFRANHPLKACLDCIASDVASWGTAYWHREHQLPGVWVCMKHRTWLFASILKATGVGRFHWSLPRGEELANRASGSPPSTEIYSLAAAAAAFVALGWHVEPDALRTTYRRALSERGLTTGSGRLKLKPIGRLYAAHLVRIRATPELDSLPGDCDSASAEVGRLVYSHGAGTHPVRHLALISWLFSSFDGFLSGCNANVRAAERNPFAPPAAAASERRLGALRAALLASISAGRSVSAASRQLNIDPTTGMAWAAAAGVKTNKRPSAMRDAVRSKMIAALRRGDSKQRAAQLGEVSISSVTRLLRTEVGLQIEWHSAQRMISRERARRLWLSVASANPFSGVKAARELEPAAYAWLYRNDHAWLTGQAARMARSRRLGGLHVDWDARDQTLAIEVRRTALELAVSNPDTRIRLWQLYQQLPELKAKLAKLDRLPLTRSAVLECTRSNALRP
jgi:hypothetical protein